ncbi:MAG: SDR family NAD(P)-dependent oxidoreductase [Pseudomonadales bacterium]
MKNGAMQDRVILITGATSGIGRETALQCAAQGARVVACGRRAEQGQRLLEEIHDLGGQGQFFTADVTDESQVKALLEHTIVSFGRLDYAFNNAGVFAAEAPLHEQEQAEWNTILAVNLNAVYCCMKHEVATMLRSRSSGDTRMQVIVNNASTVGHRGSGSSGPAYTAAKHGVIGLTRQVALSYLQENIRVNAVCPGPTLTEATAHIMEQPQVARDNLLASLNPTGELVPAAEIARAVIFLCSDSASMINGHALPVDGGQLTKL